MSKAKTLCTVYRSPKSEGMYLYVPKDEDTARVPEPLLKRFGKPELAMTLVLHAEKTLARVDVNQLLAELEDKGFYLQMPLRPEQYMQEIRNKNTEGNSG